ncbi:MAG: glycosyltransferase family 2 protein [Chloroflexota bacterium]|nr:glycosyltransferase family 2 protein [Chloroflexota bacterium]
MSAPALAIVVLTYNEELNLPGCLGSLRGLGSTLVVVDSGSTDRTLEIAAEFGARVLVHPFAGHAAQWRWALAQLNPDTEWVLGLDADQRLSPDLHAELIQLFNVQWQGLSAYDGFYLNRRQIFRGKWINHGGYYPKYLLKLFRLRKVQLDERDLMDHHFYVAGKVGELRHDLVEDNLKEANIAFWLSKHIGYAELHAREELSRRRGGHTWPIRPSLMGSPDQRVVWCKRLWYRMPLYARPVLYFVYRYILLGGILDGKQGFIFHFLQSFWYRLLVDIRLDDLLTQQSATSLD